MSNLNLVQPCKHDQGCSGFERVKIVNDIVFGSRNVKKRECLSTLYVIDIYVEMAEECFLD